MNFQFYIEKLNASEEFQKFIKENSDAFPCSCFFVIDEKANDNKQHFDYYVPSKKKIFSFQLELNCKKVPVEMISKDVPKKISLENDFDFKDIKNMILNEMAAKAIKNKMQKMLLSLQNNGKDFLIGTVFISNLGMLKVNIDISKMKIILFEKKSFFDFIRK